MEYDYIVIASGYFDPLHVGHLDYLQKARILGRELWVIVNNDIQTRQKKGYALMQERDRMKIMDCIRCVNRTILSIDNDESVCRTLEMLAKEKKEERNLIFAKGGDRNRKNIPEAETCRKLGIKIVDGLGKKIRSSSDMIERVKGG